MNATPSGPITRALFVLTLDALGMGLRLAASLSPRLRSQLSGCRTIQIGSCDGVHRHYRCLLRTVRTASGEADAPDVSLCFDNAGLGLRTLLATDAVGRIVRALLARRATYTGNAVLVLWFFGLTRFVLPVGRSAPLKRELPEAYVLHNPSSLVADRITREPVAEQLDPNWTAAHARRAQMIMIRGSAGEDVKLW